MKCDGATDCIDELRDAGSGNCPSNGASCLVVAYHHSLALFSVLASIVLHILDMMVGYVVAGTCRLLSIWMECLCMDGEQLTGRTAATIQLVLVGANCG